MSDTTRHTPLPTTVHARLCLVHVTMSDEDVDSVRAYECAILSASWPLPSWTSAGGTSFEGPVFVATTAAGYLFVILGGVLTFLRSHEPAGGDTIDHNATMPEPWEIRYAKTGEKSEEDEVLSMQGILSL